MRPSRRPVMPKYYQVEQAIRRRIGTLALGDLLPPEQELCREYGVSRATVRMAMDLLEQEGAVRRVQGRGTFVAESKLEYPLGYEPERGVHRVGEDLPYRVLAVETPPAGEEFARLFGMDAAEPVVRVRRLSVHEPAMTAVDTLLVPLAINPTLPSADFRRGTASRVCDPARQPKVFSEEDDEDVGEALGIPEEMAETLASLASDAAGDIDGQVIVADGGAR